MTSISASIVLSAALRESVNSLADTQTQIDETQLRIASGLRVNSALDNSQNYFDARALNQRASALTGILDGISRSVSTISAATTGTAAITTLLEQAESIANSALEALNDSTIEARINGTEDLSDIDDLVALSGIDNNDKLIFSYVDPDGTVDSSTITIPNGTSTDELLTAIEGIRDTNGDQVFEASLDNAGGLQIRELSGNRFEIMFEQAGGGGGADSSLASALGFDHLVIDELSNGTAVTRATISAEPSLTSVRLYDSGSTALASSTLINLTDSASGSPGDIFNGAANDSLKISIDGGTSVTVASNIFTALLQDVIDGINNNSSLNNKIEATFDSATGTLNIRAIDEDIRSIQFEITEAGTPGGSAPKFDLQKIGFGTRVLTPSNNSGNTSSESIELGLSAGTLAELEVSYNEVLSQIDALAEDALFQGINLLDGDTLTTFFNADRTSSLVTTGRTLSYDALALGSANFGRSETVGAILDDIGDSKSTVESFSSTLSSHLSIIEAREDFTTEFKTTLEEGASKLTIADLNEESAKLLALQTRQILGVSALSLASQTQQSTLRMFLD